MSLTSLLPWPKTFAAHLRKKRCDYNFFSRPDSRLVYFPSQLVRFGYYYDTDTYPYTIYYEVKYSI